MTAFQIKNKILLSESCSYYFCVRKMGFWTTAILLLQWTRKTNHERQVL